MDPTQRFTARVDDYARYRPTYPKELIQHLQGNGVLTPTSRIADIGSGTGLLARMLLDAGNAVIGVEPNRAMREAGERELSGFPRFTSVDGAAEQTTLAHASVDVVVAGQAFHWFDRSRTSSEFLRILRPPRWVVLIWNERLTTMPFLQAYERLLKTYSPDYAAVDHRRMTDDVIAEFFAPGSFASAIFPNSQTFDFAGLRGRLLSSSYAPASGHPSHEAMLADLRILFDAHADHGQVAFEYETKMYWGRLNQNGKETGASAPGYQDRSPGK